MANKWKTSVEKTLILGVIFTGFIFGPLIIILAISVIMSAAPISGSNSERILFLVMYGYLWTPIVAVGFLLVYVLRMKNNQPSDFNSQSRNGPPPPPKFAWKTDLSPKERIEILRRREWAFLLDVVPGLALNIIAISIIAKFSYGFSFSAEAKMLYLIMWIVSISLCIYIVCKDRFEGASWGKRMTGCRVVNLSDGVPIGLGKSFLRNILLLIPMMAMVELAVASLRQDRRRIGDLFAETTTVQGEPDFVNGVENTRKKKVEAIPPRPHALDD
ncbi:MAG: RDD family protein [Mariniblastus sp.]